MTSLKQSFEGITPTGTTVTTGNSGVGTDRAFDAMSIGATSTLQSSNVQVAHGSLAGLLTVAAAESAYMQWDTAMGTKTSVWARFYLYFSALPTGTIRLFGATNAGSAALSVQIGTSGKLSILDSSSANVGTMTTVISTSQQIRVELMAVMSATVGQGEVKLFNSAESSSVTDTLTSTALLNTNTQATQYRFGRAASATGAVTFYIDDIELNDTGYPGPLAVAGAGASIQNATIRHANPRVAIREFNR